MIGRLPGNIGLSLLALGTLAALSSEAADPLADAFARMDKTAQKFRGMTADIEQTAYTQVVDSSAITRGTIKLKRPKPDDVRFLVDFTSGVDAPKSAAYAGAEIQTYNPKTKLEQIYNVATKKEMIEQAMSLGFGAGSAEIKASYDVSWVGAENLNGQPASHIKLIPKTKEMQAQVKQADLWISDSLGVPVQQKFLPPSSGNYNLFKYSNIKVNPPLSDKDLQLKPDKGFSVNRVGN